jgi:hypothetical protein
MMEPPDQRDRFTLEAERALGPSIRPIYRNSGRKPQPEHIASCLLLNVDGVPIVCTAAHVADHLAEHSLFIAGTLGTRLVHIPIDAVKATSAPGGDRSLRYRALISKAAEVGALRGVEFLKPARFVADAGTTDERLYTALGFARSRNKKKVNHTTKSIDIRASMYTAGVEEMPDLSAEIGVSVAEHLFLRWDEHSFASDGSPQNTFSAGI